MDGHRDGGGRGWRRAAGAGLVAAALALAAAAGPGPAAARTIRIPGISPPALVDATDPWALAGRLAAAGLTAEAEILEDGTPRIRAGDEGLTFFLLFYGCTSEVDCTAVDFSAGFTFDAPLEWSVINAWNAGRIIGKAHLDDEGMPWISHLVTLEGGVSEANFAAVLAAWRIALHDFAAHIGFSK